MSFKIGFNESDLNSVIAFFESDIKESTEKGLKKASELIPGFIQDNINSYGANRDEGEWESVPVFWLRVRETWPDPEIVSGFLTGPQSLYLSSHISGADKPPLRDTDALYNSFQLLETAENNDGFEFVTGSRLDYGQTQNEGGLDNRDREHMFLVVGEHTDAIDETFEKGFDSA